MPDHSAFSRSIKIELLDALDRFLDAEKLLVPRNLAVTALEYGEAADHIEQPFRTAKRVDQTILLRNRSWTGSLHLVEKRLRLNEIAGEHRTLFILRQRPVDGSKDVGVLVFLVAPDLPEL